ncbi:class I adenylate-forming enzyme family protein [Rhodococcoides yunnanense]|uniref:class I adenylate-forming enzyme family protein n=1 Tax=Rhodococcoides yunnanense TaxID=278209 RepID=UPI000932A7E7|nr:class I adenylate-forming enzyme family protein [Rhodococcus yunnanensis]
MVSQEADIISQLTAAGAKYEVHEEKARGHVLPVFRHRAKSLREVLESARAFDERIFIIDGDDRLTYATHLQYVDAFASALQNEYSVEPGQRVAIFAANRWEWIVSFWAAASIGAIPCAMNGWWTVAEFAHAVDLIEPVLVIGDAVRLGRVAGYRGSFATLDLDSHFGATIRRYEGAVPMLPRIEEDDPGLILFTSGTTGRAKAVTLSHRSMIGFAQLNQFAGVAGGVAFGMPIPKKDDPLIASPEVSLITSPLFHVSMLQGFVLSSFVKGGAIVLLRGRFDPERVLRTIENERVTTWSALGSAASRTAMSPALGKYDTTSIIVLGVGGAPVSPTVQQRLRDAFPSAFTLGMGYSSTEAGVVVATINGVEYVSRPLSTGRPNVTVDIEIRDPFDGRPMGEGEYGEVHVRSPYTMSGYWNDPLASAEVLKEDGWLAMGDIARVEGGYLYIDARARDLILVNAENVSPTEVEYVLDAHPAVSEVAVFAIDDVVTGDAVCAVVVVQEAGQTSQESLDQWCRDRLAHFKVPTRWYISVEPLPRTPTGKVKKNSLRSQIESVRLSH